MDFLVGQQLSHLGHMTCTGRAPTTTFCFHAKSQQMSQIAFHAAQSPGLIVGNLLADAPVQSPAFLSDLADPTVGLLRLFAFSHRGIISEEQGLSTGGLAFS